MDILTDIMLSQSSTSSNVQFDLTLRIWHGAYVNNSKMHYKEQNIKPSITNRKSPTEQKLPTEPMLPTVMNFMDMEKSDYSHMPLRNINWIFIEADVSEWHLPVFFDPIIFRNIY